jgi:hypothetical protein
MLIYRNESLKVRLVLKKWWLALVVNILIR